MKNVIARLLSGLVSLGLATSLFAAEPMTEPAAPKAGMEQPAKPAKPAKSAKHKKHHGKKHGKKHHCKKHHGKKHHGKKNGMKKDKKQSSYPFSNNKAVN